MNNQTSPARTTSTQRATPPIQAPSTRIVSPATIDDDIVSIGENLPPIETAFPAALNINTRGKLMTWAITDDMPAEMKQNYKAKAWLKSETYKKFIRMKNLRSNRLNKLSRDFPVALYLHNKQREQFVLRQKNSNDARSAEVQV